MAASVEADAGTALTMTRIFDAPPERVFDAWQDAGAIGQWLFATPGGVMERVELDARVGGRFRLIERRGDVRAEMAGQFHVVDRPRRLVFSFAIDRAPTPTPTRVTVLIEPFADGARLTLSHAMDPQWAPDHVRTSWTRELDGLATIVSGPRELVITRLLDAPLALAWRAWADPAMAARWAGPRGYTATHVSGDLRPGGAWRTGLRNDETGATMWHSGVYLEVVAPERLVFTFGWDRADGSRSPETVVTLSFANEGGRTRMVFRQGVFESPTAATAHEGGWTSAFERLAEDLAAAVADSLA